MVENLLISPLFWLVLALAGLACAAPFFKRTFFSPLDVPLPYFSAFLLFCCAFVVAMGVSVQLTFAGIPDVEFVVSVMTLAFLVFYLPLMAIGGACVV